MKLLLDIDTLSYFWIRMSSQLEIIDHSREFDVFIDSSSKKVLDHFEMIQPTMNLEDSVLEQLEGKIIQLRHLATDRRFRLTFHQSSNDYLMIGWPMFKSLNEVRDEGFGKIMSHPACQLTDLLIVKDVLNKSQKKITKLETQKLEDKIKEQQRINQHQAKLASLGELAAGVGHEINNPLAIAIGLASKLTKLLKNEKKYSNYRKIFEKQSEAHSRIKKIVDNLRIFSRFEEQQDESFLVDKAIKSVLSLLVELYEKEGIKVRYKNAYLDQLFIHGNYGEFQQILMNLLSNAKDAIEGKEKKLINIEVSDIGSEIRISISDNGVGIENQILNKIFDPFFTTKEVGKGTGLGLGLVNKMVKNLKGRIIAKSALGEGSEFIIFFPKVESIDIESQQVDSNANQIEDDRVNGSILLVDDEDDIRELLVDILESIGLSVTEVNCPLAALKKLETEQYDFVLSDMKMPKMQGDEFLKKAYELNGQGAKYFILTGGVAKDLSQDKDLNRIVSKIITKPFEEDELLEVFKLEND